MLQPRNTLVVVAPIDEKENWAGRVIVPDDTNEQYQKCEIISVGPGMSTHSDESSLCSDLYPEQHVLVQLMTRRTGGGLQPVGPRFKTKDGRDLMLVEQSQIVATVDPDSD
jgi:co-chaperonin GroES (HSP10)